MVRDLAQLFGLFFRIGFCSVGGGYVMLALLREELVEKRRWLTDADLMTYYAIGQATPGIIAVNTATFVGYRRRGVCGAFAATAGMVAPSLIVIMLVAAFLAGFQENPIVQRAFRGIRVAVAMLLLFTVTSLVRSTVKSPMALALAAAAFVLVAFGGLSPIPLVLASAVAGLLAGPWRRRVRPC